MKCDDCDEPIVGTYYEKNGKNYCEKDYQKYRKKCSVCGDFISGTYYTTKDDRIICAKDYKSQLGGLDCRKCGNEVTGEILRAVDSVFHPECFVCCECGISLAGDEVRFAADPEKNLYCIKDYHMKFSPRCGGCGEPIAPKEGEKSVSKVRIFDKDFHPDCFKCADCGDVLGGDKKCYPLEDIPFCLDCHKKKISNL